MAERGVGVRGTDNKLHQMTEILVRLDNYFMGRTLSDLTRQPVSVDPEITKYLNYESSLTLSETVKIYAYRQLLNLHPISYKSALEQLNRIKQIFGADTPIKTITRQQCVEAARVISYLPANMNLRYKDMTPQEAEIAGREDGARIISTKTANDYLTRMKALFSFAEDDQIIDKNPARNLTLARSNEDG